MSRVTQGLLHNKGNCWENSLCTSTVHRNPLKTKPSYERCFIASLHIIFWQYNCKCSTDSPVYRGLLNLRNVKFKVCKSVHHRTIQINHQPDATIFQFIMLTFIYSSTCFGRSLAHYQELNDCSSSLWFYLRIVVIAVLCSWSGWLFNRPDHEHNTAITSIAHSIICTRLFRGKMHSDWFNGIEILPGRWQHGEKVGYCYPRGLENTLCKWDIYVPLVTEGSKGIVRQNLK